MLKRLLWLLLVVLLAWPLTANAWFRHGAVPLATLVPGSTAPASWSYDTSTWAAAPSLTPTGNPADYGYGEPAIVAIDDKPFQTFSDSHRTCIVAYHSPTATEMAAGLTSNVSKVAFFLNNGPELDIVAPNATTTGGRSGWCAQISAADVNAASGGVDGQFEVRYIVYLTTGTPTILQGQPRLLSDFVASQTGSTLTVSSVISGFDQSLAFGVALSAFGLPQNTLIMGTSTVNPTLCVADTGSNCTGAKGTGTYALNTSQTMASQRIQASAYYSMFLNANFGGTLPASVVHVATTGVDSGNCSSIVSPCLTAHYAITQLPADKGGATIKFAAGSYAYSNVTESTQFAAATQWLTYTHEDGLAATDVVFTSTGGGPRVRKVRMREVAAFATSFDPGNVGDPPYAALWLDHVTCYGVVSTAIGGGCAAAPGAGMWVNDSTFHTMTTGPSSANLVENTSIYNLTEDALHNVKWALNVQIWDSDRSLHMTATETAGSNVLTSVSNFALIAVGTHVAGSGIPGSTGQTLVTAFDAGAATIMLSANSTCSSTCVVSDFTTGSHPDGWDGAIFQANVLFDGVIIPPASNPNSYLAQLWFTDATTPVLNAALVNSVMNNAPNPYGYIGMQMGNATRNMLWINNVWTAGMQWRTDTAFSATDVLIENNTCSSKITPNSVAGVTYSGSTTCH